VTVGGLAAGEHAVRITRVGYRHNDVYTAYLDLGAPGGLPGRPDHLPEDVVAKLRAACAGVPEVRKVSVRAGEPVVVELPMNENDVYFVEVE
jgi:xylan 1,4-beta-xylosidase